MSFSRPMQWYHSHVDPIWRDGTLNSIIQSQKFYLGDSLNALLLDDTQSSVVRSHRLGKVNAAGNALRPLGSSCAAPTTAAAASPAACSCLPRRCAAAAAATSRAAGAAESWTSGAAESGAAGAAESWTGGTAESRAAGTAESRAAGAGESCSAVALVKRGGGERVGECCQSIGPDAARIKLEHKNVDIRNRCCTGAIQRSIENPRERNTKVIWCTSLF